MLRIVLLICQCVETQSPGIVVRSCETTDSTTLVIANPDQRGEFLIGVHYCYLVISREPANPFKFYISSPCFIPRKLKLITIVFYF